VNVGSLPVSLLTGNLAKLSRNISPIAIGSSPHCTASLCTSPGGGRYPLPPTPQYPYSCPPASGFEPSSAPSALHMELAGATSQMKQNETKLKASERKMNVK
jgi:hypothetical protein